MSEHVRRDGPGAVVGETLALVAAAAGAAYGWPVTVDAIQPVQPLVGRANELAELELRLDAVRSPGAQVLAIRGEPGIGKTRLLAELVHAPVRAAPWCWPAAHLNSNPRRRSRPSSTRSTRT
jgi:hypothetical protein